MKKKIILITSMALCLIAAPCGLRAEDEDKAGKRDPNVFLENHPKIKEKVLAKFDTNHNGKLDGEEIEAFRKWFREHRGELKERIQQHRKNSGSKTDSSTTTTPAAQ